MTLSSRAPGGFTCQHHDSDRWPGDGEKPRAGESSPLWSELAQCMSQAQQAGGCSAGGRQRQRRGGSPRTGVPDSARTPCCGGREEGILHSDWGRWRRRQGGSEQGTSFGRYEVQGGRGRGNSSRSKWARHGERSWGLSHTPYLAGAISCKGWASKWSPLCGSTLGDWGGARPQGT